MNIRSKIQQVINACVISLIEKSKKDIVSLASENYDTSQFSQAIKRATNKSIEELCEQVIDENEQIVEARHKGKLIFKSEFPFIGRNEIHPQHNNELKGLRLVIARIFVFSFCQICNLLDERSVWNDEYDTQIDDIDVVLGSGLKWIGPQDDVHVDDDSDIDVVLKEQQEE